MPTCSELSRKGSPSWAPLLSEPPRQRALEHLELNLQPGLWGLDLGSGRGHDAALLAAAGARAVGLDLHWPSLRRAARAHPEVRFVLGRAESLPFVDSCFATLYSHSVLQYTNRDLALTECSRVLAPRGRYAFIENLAGNPVARLYRTWRRLRGARFPDHLHPRRHFSFGELGLYSRRFGPVSTQVFHLASPVLAGLARYRCGATAPHPLALRLLRWEERLLLALPWLRRWAWLVVICGERGEARAEEE